MSDSSKTQPVKLTITFADGHTQDFDTFVSVVVEGLVPAGKEDGLIVYMAPKEGFVCYSMSSLQVCPTVVAGILKSLNDIIKRLVGGFDAAMAAEVSRALHTLNTEETDLYKNIAVIHRDSRSN